MANVKISAASDIGSLVASDMLPVARSGSSTAYHATAAEIASYANVSAGAATYGNVGRNKLHNAMFNVAQRGSGPFVAAGYGLDRWEAILLDASDSLSWQRDAASDAQRAAVGDESLVWALDNTFNGGAAAAAGVVIAQRIEGVRRLSGKQVTVSFWAWAAAGTPKLGVSLDQLFGTGGSPSAAVLGTGQAVTLSTTGARYSVVFTLPSSAGKTLGTNGDDSTGLNVWYSAGTANATRAGSIGVQSAQIGIWGVQLEVGSAASPLEKPDPRMDRANCQRFYTYGTGIWSFYASGAGQNAFFTVPFSVVMRATPTVGVTGSGGSGWTTVTGYTAELDAFVIEAVSSTTGYPVYFNYSYAASADL